MVLDVVRAAVAALAQGVRLLSSQTETGGTFGLQMCNETKQILKRAPFVKL